jgi:2-polyprenyl-3-methyl-5-hydroxy-6-metoxy-1,4-benzoquinol methylase
MTDDETLSIASHFSRSGRVEDYLSRPDPMNAVRRDLVRRMALENARASSQILEIGCGIGTLTMELAGAGLSCTAIDLSPEMVERAKSLVGAAAKVEQANLFDYLPGSKFDVVIANGVLPYYRDKPRFLQRVADLLETPGVAIIIHRNALFSLFALNRGTIEFMTEELLAELPLQVRARIAEKLKAIPGLAEVPLQDVSAELYRSAENPLTVSDLYREAGLSLREIRYCFIHGAPPRLPGVAGVPDTAALQRRYEKGWEGMFLGSQFAALATRR